MKRILLYTLIFLLIPIVTYGSQIFSVPKLQVMDDSGDPAASWTLNFYYAGTSTPLTVYSDSGLATSLGTSVTLDSRGEYGAIFLGASAKVVLKDSDATTKWTVDNWTGGTIHPLDHVVLSSYTNLTTAIASISTTVTTLYIDKDDTMSGDVTMPATLAVKGVKGNSITLGTHALTVNGRLEATNDMFTLNSSGDLTIAQTPTAGNERIFYETSTGATSLSGGYANTAWWGLNSDASTDDATVLQAAIDSLTKGTLYHPYLGGLSLVETQLDGDSDIRIECESGAGFYIEISDAIIEFSSEDSFEIRGCEFKGDDNSADTGQHGVSIIGTVAAPSYGFLIEGNYIHDFGRNGIRTRGTDSNTDQIYGGRIAQNRVESNQGDGIMLYRGAADISVVGNNTLGNNFYGIFVDDVSTGACGGSANCWCHNISITGNTSNDDGGGIGVHGARGCTVTGNTITLSGQTQTSTQGYGIDLNSAVQTDSAICRDNVVSGNSISYTRQHGIVLQGIINCAITGNTIVDSGYDADDGGDNDSESGIYMTKTTTSDADYNSIAGNTVVRMTATTTCKMTSGVELPSSDANYNLISGNMIRAAVGSFDAISDSGTGTIVGLNYANAANDAWGTTTFQNTLLRGTHVLSSATHTIADSADGNAATYSIGPGGDGEITRPREVLSCSDSDGCDITMLETTALAGGQIVTFVNSSANDVDFADQANVLSLPGAAVTLGQRDVLTLIYQGDPTEGRWIGYSASNN